MFKKLLFNILILLFAATGPLIKAQNATADTLIMKLKMATADSVKFKLQSKIARIYFNQDNQLCLKYLDDALKTAEKMKSAKLQAEILNDISKHHFSQKNYLIGYPWLERLEDLSEKSNDAEITLLALDARRDLFSQLNQLDKAVEVEQKISRIHHDKKRFVEEAYSLFLCGWMSFNARQYEKGLVFLHNSRSISKRLNDEGRVNAMYGWLGNTHNGLKNYDSALYYRGLVHTIELSKNNTFPLGESYRYMGDIYFNMGNFVKALEFYNNAIIFYKKANSPRHLLLRTYRVRTLNSMKRFEEAAKELDSLNLILTTTKDNLSKYYSNLFGVITYEKTKEFDKAFRCLKILDSIAKVDKTTEVNSLIEIAEFKKEREKSEALVKAEFEKQQAITNANLQNKQLLLDRNSKELLLLEQDNKLKMVTLNQSNLELKQKQLENESQKRQVELLNKDKKLSEFLAAQQESDIKSQRNLLFIFATSGILVLILLGFVVKGYVQKRKDNKLISLQKIEVEQKHKEITDSINYAERIQRSFLATKQLLDENFNRSAMKGERSDYFIYFKPKDVVSGDFYWASKLANGNFAFVTADSTGHGVPGAIMSLLNITSLEKAIEITSDPSEILNLTRKTIINRLKGDGSLDGGKDGMDCSLMSFDFKNNILSYAAANNPVWIVRGEQIIQLDADKMPVGKHENDSVPFKQGSFELKQNDVVYALTDGMPDQFGGSKGKKFMYKQLKELLISIANDPMEVQKNKINDAFMNWKGSLEQVDDVCVVGIRI